jgi:heat shock protein 1/8
MVAIGIDLGTTNSCVASYTSNGVEVIQNHSGSRTTPSFVLINDDEIRVGKSAKEANVKNSQNLVYDAKRMIGKVHSDKDLQSDISTLKWPFKVDKDTYDRPILNIPNLKTRVKKVYLPEEISAFVLQEIKNVVEDLHLGHGKNLADAVITVPAYFNDSQKKATEDAANLAGLKVLKLLSEPSAAGLAFCYQRLKEDLSNEHTILVYDLGGGTFDVSIMYICNGQIEVKCVNGDTHLGGNDFDARLIEFLIKKFKEKSDEDVKNNKKALWKLRDAAIKAKEHLSAHLHAEISIDSLQNDKDFEYDIKRSEFDTICQDLFNRTLEIVDKALKDANMSPSSIHEILLVGGSSRIPKIQEMLKTKFGGDKINKTINGDEAVAYGAAIQAAIINGEIERQCNMVLMDVTPLSIGTDVKKCSCGKSCNCTRYTSVIIPRNTKIPTKKTRRFETRKDNQTKVKIDILEGENSEADKNHLLGSLTVDGIPKNKAGEEKIDVSYEIDGNGMLTINAVNRSTGGQANATINYNKKRLNSDDVKEMLTKLKIK